jgi:hypothetical protein
MMDRFSRRFRRLVETHRTAADGTAFKGTLRLDPQFAHVRAPPQPIADLMFRIAHILFDLRLTAPSPAGEPMRGVIACRV